MSNNTKLSSKNIHYHWNNSLSPAIEIGPGEEIEIETLDAGGGQLTPLSGPQDIANFDFSRIDPATGPIRVEGAEPGDALVIRIKELEIGDWGWTGTLPGFGLLSDIFTEVTCYISKITEDEISLPFGVVLPTMPMIGVVGVAPPEPGNHAMIAPHRYGGNMDIRNVGVGSTIILPVGVSGALLSFGDAHAAMGDGEVCGTAIETSGRILASVDLVKGRAPKYPIVEYSNRSNRTGDFIAASGIGSDLFQACRDAVLNLIDEVTRRSSFSPMEAYILASLTADLKISEVVDAPNWVVTAHLPASLLS